MRGVIADQIYIIRGQTLKLFRNLHKAIICTNFSTI